MPGLYDDTGLVWCVTGCQTTVQTVSAGTYGQKVQNMDIFSIYKTKGILIYMSKKEKSYSTSYTCAHLCVVLQSFTYM